MDTIWKNTIESLKNFTDVLVCNKCHREPINAVTFTNCGHFFCKKCVENDTICAKCGTPVQPVEIHNDHMINSLTSYCNSITKIIGKRDFQNATTDALCVSQIISSVPMKINYEAFNRKRVPQKNINKKNGKGETKLHSACLKNDVEYVKLLLAAGAETNTKDNAGWTPLQEVVDAGYTGICRMLLEFGAQPNTPGIKNRTALHEAVINKRLDEVKLLLQYHAKSDVYDEHGKRPIDYCEPSKDTMSCKIWNLLQKGSEMNDTSINLNSTMEQSFVVPHSLNRFTIFASNLQEKNKKRLLEVAAKHKIKVVSMYQAQITHVVMEANKQNTVQLSYDVMMAILRGNWLLNSEWFSIAMDVDDISKMDLELFEISGAPVTGIPRKARENAQNQNPGLFDQCYFYFALQPKSTYYVNEMQLTRDGLERLVENGKGTILKRQPDPEEVKTKGIIIPFHIANNSSHPLYKCTHYIIYVPGKDEPRVKYNMSHIKSLPLLWLIECIEKFTLVNPSYLGLL
ncbi:BRCA1-associated RING domain protein 1 isoform X2 [Halictus rubicundus]